ncbi:hypothetical protein D3C76_1484970 [compost metagenome]
MSTPRIMAELYKRRSTKLYMDAAFAKTDPYIPNQNKMDNGLNRDINNPAKNDLCKVSLLLISLDAILFAPIRLSIPVYVRTKKPNNHKKV